MQDATAVVREFSETCIRCGLCARTDCGNFGEGVPCLGDVCDSLLAGEDAFFHFPFTCALCNRCTVRCPVGLHASDACRNLRSLRMADQPATADMYRHIRTDYKYNMFTLMRSDAVGELGDIALVEGEAGAGAEADRTAFFPGCSLSSYAPALTEKVMAWLRAQGIASYALHFCCGALFYEIGLFDEFERFRGHAQALLREHGISRLVVTCPHCTQVLPVLLEGSGVEIARLPDLLLDRGMVSHVGGRLSIHDSCHDRDGGVFHDAVLQMFPDARIVPLAHEREDSLCCGSGGMTSTYAPAYCEYRCKMRLAEIDAAGPDEVVSPCFSCVNTLQRTGSSTPVRHYLEYLFDETVDWDAIRGQAQRIMADPRANELLQEPDPLFA